jgi:regulator of sigma E protease
MLIVNIIIGLIGLGIVIIIHEAGHFIIAKASGITVEAFSVGWGKKLFGVQRGETEYRLSLIPLGGYCKMKGEEQLLKAWENKENTIPKEEGSFFKASPWKRIAVVVAGPTANLLFAVLVFSIIWSVGFTIRTFDNKVILASEYADTEEQQVYPADRAGLKTGDEIVAIGGQPVRHYQDLQELVGKSAGETLTMTVEREQRRVQLSITPQLDPDTGMGKIGVYAWVKPVVGRVQENSAAAIAGLQPGDRIIAVDGEEIQHSLDVFEVMENNPEELTLTYQRNGEKQTTTLMIPYGEQGNPQLGFSFATEEFGTPQVNGLQALGKGFEETGNTLSLVFKSIGLLFQGINLREAVSGPIRITYFVGQVASQGFQLGVKSGFTYLFRFLSILSVAVFVMNLLPIPALDGGQFILYLGEGLSNRELRPRLVYRYQVIGISIIIGLILFTTFNDIFYLIQQ